MDIMPSLMEEQRVRIEKNMGLVGRVIRDCVHALDMGCIYTYEDLFQVEVRKLWMRPFVKLYLKRQEKQHLTDLKKALGL